MIFGGLMMAAAATMRGEWVQLTFTWRTGAAELYLILFGSLVGYSAYVYALKHLPLSTVSLYAYVNPMIAVVLGTLLLREPFGWRVVVAPAVVFAGIAVVKFRGLAGLSARATKAHAAA
jgi:drug/metabolite transporter (DMT)-like permease